MLPGTLLSHEVLKSSVYRHGLIRNREAKASTERSDRVSLLSHANQALLPRSPRFEAEAPFEGFEPPFTCWHAGPGFTYMITLTDDTRSTVKCSATFTTKACCTAVLPPALSCVFALLTRFGGPLTVAQATCCLCRCLLCRFSCR